jgi:beta-lactamase class D
MKDSARGTIPASTFKIFNSLVGLQEKVISPNEVIKWDGRDKTFRGNSVKSWNVDTNLESAFKNSTIWFYVELAKRIKRSTYADYLRQCSYGNLDLSEKGDDFWNYGNMEMSPKNQVDFLIKLYRDELPFDKGNMRLIKSYMRISTEGAYALSGKSGWGMKDCSDIGWLIGFLENGSNVYVFATRIMAGSDNLPADFSKLRTVITLEAFRALNII